MKHPDDLAVLQRYSSPTKYDQAPMGTRCKIIGSEDIYIQISRDEDNPIWEKKS